MRSTEKVLLAMLAGLLGWEAFTLRSKNDEHVTISRTLRRLCRRHPILAVMVGVLVGHLFWPLSEDKE